MHSLSITTKPTPFMIYCIRVEVAIMRWVVLWDTACKFNAFILNQLSFNCLITSASTLLIKVKAAEG